MALMLETEISIGPKIILGKIYKKKFQRFFEKALGGI